ncbi:MAG: hypothetical protein IPK55_12980 [Streptococcus sp.]|nr:hypothetical protein [Streptococcus sp.]
MTVRIHSSAAKFQKEIKIIIDSFEKAKEWSDLSNSLSKLKKLFEKYDKGPIPEKNSLAKRLCK